MEKPTTIVASHLASPLLRRRYPRRRIRRPVSVLCNGQFLNCSGEDIGEGGISFAHTEALQTEAWVVVNFALPETTLFLSIRAQIKSVRKNQLGLNIHGLSFREIDFEIKREIRKYVTAKESAEH